VPLREHKPSPPRYVALSTELHVRLRTPFAINASETWRSARVGVLLCRRGQWKVAMRSGRSVELLLLILLGLLLAIFIAHLLSC